MLLSALPSSHPTSPWWAPEGAGCPIAHQKEAQPVLPALGSHWGGCPQQEEQGHTVPPQECRAPPHPCSGLGPHGLWVSPAPPGMLQDRWSQAPLPGGPAARCPHSCWGQHPPAQPPLAACPRPVLVQKALPSTTGCPAQVVPLLWSLQLPVACGYCQIPSILSSTCFFFFFFLLAFCKSIHFLSRLPRLQSSEHCNFL